MAEAVLRSACWAHRCSYCHLKQCLVLLNWSVDGIEAQEEGAGCECC